jgi:hypothetical protein
MMIDDFNVSPPDAVTRKKMGRYNRPIETHSA